MKKIFLLLMGMMFLAACATTPKYEGVFVPKEYVYGRGTLLGY
jgi:hypothetical protein